MLLPTKCDILTWTCLLHVVHIFLVDQLITSSEDRRGSIDDFNIIDIVIPPGGTDFFIVGEEKKKKPVFMTNPGKKDLRMSMGRAKAKGEALNCRYFRPCS